MTICRQRSTFFASGDREQSHIATEQEQQQPNSIFKHFALFAFCHFFFLFFIKQVFVFVCDKHATYTHTHAKSRTHGFGDHAVAAACCCWELENLYPN